MSPPTGPYRSRTVTTGSAPVTTTTRTPISLAASSTFRQVTDPTMLATIPGRLTRPGPRAAKREPTFERRRGSTRARSRWGWVTGADPPVKLQIATCAGSAEVTEVPSIATPPIPCLDRRLASARPPNRGNTAVQIDRVRNRRLCQPTALHWCASPGSALNDLRSDPWHLQPHLPLAYPESTSSALPNYCVRHAFSHLTRHCQVWWTLITRNHNGSSSTPVLTCRSGS